MAKSCNCMTLAATLAILAVFFVACQIFLFTPDWAPITALARYNRSWLRQRRPECKVVLFKIYPCIQSALEFHNLHWKTSSFIGPTTQVTGACVSSIVKTCRRLYSCASGCSGLKQPAPHRSCRGKWSAVRPSEITSWFE